MPLPGSLIIGVHGIAKQQLGRYQLREPWRRALADGIERAIGRPAQQPPLDIAYYGDLFLREGDGTKGGPDPSEWLLADLRPEEIAVLLAAAVEEIPTSPIKTSEQKGYSRSPRPLQSAIRGIDRYFGATVGALCLGELRQVLRYLREPETASAVRRRVDQIVDADSRVLIGHSLGSVIAFDYLRRTPHTPLRLLITLGSPLGLTFVRRALISAADAEPTNLTWVNIRDPRDPVACVKLDGLYNGVQEFDVNNQADAHAAERYLGKRRTGEAVVAALPELMDPGTTG